jgi:predicted transcriptional regulator YheO
VTVRKSGATRNGAEPARGSRSTRAATEASAPGQAAPSDSAEPDALIGQLADLAEFIGSALPMMSEVVLYDLSTAPPEVVAKYGNVTGPGQADLPSELSPPADAEADEPLWHEQALADGRVLRSATKVVRNARGAPAAAIRINTDISAWLTVRDIAASFAGDARSAAPDARVAPAVGETALASWPDTGDETIDDVDRLAEYLLARAIKNVGIPVELMRKEHKMRVVEELRERGIFLMREAAERVAAALDVSRFTIYNYLNDLDGQAGADGSTAD